MVIGEPLPGGFSYGEPADSAANVVFSRQGFELEAACSDTARLQALLRSRENGAMVSVTAVNDGRVVMTRDTRFNAGDQVDLLPGGGDVDLGSAEYVSANGSVTSLQYSAAGGGGYSAGVGCALWGTPTEPSA